MAGEKLVWLLFFFCRLLVRSQLEAALQRPAQNKHCQHNPADDGPIISNLKHILVEAGVGTVRNSSMKLSRSRSQPRRA